MAEEKQAGWRLYVAGALMLLSLSAVGFIPLVTSSGLSVEMKTTISGLLVFGIPQVLMVAAVALAGKSGFNFLKGRMFGFIKTMAPPQTVGRTRYRIGLVLFVVPLIFGFLAPYLGELVPLLVTHDSIFAVTGDVMFLLSFFVLGGDFWDKVRSLFVYDARAVLPDKTVE